MKKSITGNKGESKIVRKRSAREFLLEDSVKDVR